MKTVFLCILSLFAVVGAAGAIGYRPTLGRWGHEGVRSMVAIGLICLAAALIGLVPLAMASIFKPSLIGQAALSGTLFRLMLTGGGLFGYQSLAHPQLGAFLFWAVVFYLLLLCVETGFGVYLTRKNLWNGFGQQGGDGMNWMILASHDPLDHVLPHRFTEPIIRWPWDINLFNLNIIKIGPHATYFTNHMMMSVVAAFLTLLIFIPMGRRYAAMLNSRDVERSAPRGFGNLIEAMMVFIRENVARPVLGDKTDRFMPFLWTVFFYILICNLLGMIPFDSIIYLASGRKLQHIGGTATSNIMITAGLAICAFLMIHFSGVAQVYKDLVAGTYGHHDHHDPVDDKAHAHGHAQAHDRELHGGGHEYGLAYTGKQEFVAGYHHGKSPVVAAVAAPALYLWNFAPHVFKPEKTDGPMAIAQWIMDLGMWAILLALELLGAVIKAFALTIRLFANMVAGHVVLASLLALILVVQSSIAAHATIGGITALGAAALSCLELFVCFLQAYVFTFLTTLFIGAAVSPEH